ncbi:MAG: hypothetical protein GY795_18325 [Desulfobacterales bacterium]|nr:hypothetical protein [Desulfobacterales bacterium]
MYNSSDQPFVYTINNSETGEDEYYVSFVPHDLVFQRGLPVEAIIGKLIDGPELFQPEHFRPNVRFLEFLHNVIAKHSLSCPGLIAEAKRRKEGFVYIIDARTPTPNEEVPPEDIIGAVEVRNGTVLGYQGNPNYQVFTASGMMMIDSWWRSKLLDEIKRIMEKAT